MQFESGYSIVNGLKMYYQIYGSGAIPLVLVHGGGSTIETTFSNIIPFLAANRMLIGVDLQAHGRTGDREAGVTFAQDADDVAALLSNLGFGQADFMGFSNGGSSVLQVAIRHPGLVRKLIAVAACTKRAGLMPGFFEFMETASLDNMPAPLQEAYLAVAENKEGLQVMHDKDRDRMRAFKDWPDESLRAIDVPALIMTGNRDVVTVAHTTEISELIPNAELLVMPGVHGECIGEICTFQQGSRLPEFTAYVVNEFLERQNG
ncbi:alpha/beta fold hydrolase, partial [Dyadobacter crusticola]|uniref:alpha/beta fold hydrolase n=1 Tax=Dyadobacter crusticola TaxID=292407 RepID=UPI0004E225C9